MILFKKNFQLKTECDGVRFSQVDGDGWGVGDKGGKTIIV